jgi:YVTN family beta-propeller protein
MSRSCPVPARRGGGAVLVAVVAAVIAAALPADVLAQAGEMAAAPPADQSPPPAAAVPPVAGQMPPVVNPANVYSEAAAGHWSPAVAGALPRVYVPNVLSGDVSVVDPATMRVVDRFKAGHNPQHVIPSWDLKTLWVASSVDGRRFPGSVMPIDPTTAKPGRIIMLRDAYNMYFMPDGSAAIVVAEALKQLELRDPHTMALKDTVAVPQCAGINHADFAADGSYAIFTCEFRGGGLAKVDLANRKVLGYLKLSHSGMPQDIRIAPDGKVFYVADMMANGVYLVDGETFKEVGFIPTGHGAHGLTISRDGARLFVSNRGSHGGSHPHGDGSISVIDFATRTVVQQWPIPGGGSPDMGNVSADGSTLWLSGRLDDVVYAIDTTSGEVKKIPVGHQPHGVAVWPLPGRYSLGHTGNMR